MDDHADHTRSYNVSGKVMVTAIISLSFVVVFVAFLHIYVRYVFRRQARRRTTLWQQGLHTTAQEPPKSGLDPTIVGSLPTFLFKQDQKARTIECAVCLSNLEDGEMVKILPNCKHSFHVTCIDTWLSKNLTCPVCRTAAEPQQVVVEPVEITTAPPLDQESCIEGTSDGSGKVLGSSSRFSSFRKMLSKDRSSNRIHSGLEDHLERQ